MFTLLEVIQLEVGELEKTIPDPKSAQVTTLPVGVAWGTCGTGVSPEIVEGHREEMGYALAIEWGKFRKFSLKR